MIGKGKRPRDPNQLAKWIVDRSTNEVEGPEAVTAPPPSDLSEYMAAIGRKGGQIGGKRRLKTMTKKERTKIATKAATTHIVRQNQPPSNTVLPVRYLC